MSDHTKLAEINAFKNIFFDLPAVVLFFVFKHIINVKQDLCSPSFAAVLEW